VRARVPLPQTPPPPGPLPAAPAGGDGGAAAAGGRRRRPPRRGPHRGPGRLRGPTRPPHRRGASSIACVGSLNGKAHGGWVAAEWCFHACGWARVCVGKRGMLSTPQEPCHHRQPPNRNRHLRSLHAPSFDGVPLAQSSPSSPRGLHDAAAFRPPPPRAFQGPDGLSAALAAHELPGFTEIPAQAPPLVCPLSPRVLVAIPLPTLHPPRGCLPFLRPGPFGPL